MWFSTLVSNSEHRVMFAGFTPGLLSPTWLPSKPDPLAGGSGAGFLPWASSSLGQMKVSPAHRLHFKLPICIKPSPWDVRVGVCDTCLVFSYHTCLGMGVDARGSLPRYSLCYIVVDVSVLHCIWCLSVTLYLMITTSSGAYPHLLHGTQQAVCWRLCIILICIWLLEVCWFCS